MKTSDFGEDPILELSGDLDGLPADLSENFDRYLNATYGIEIEGPDTLVP